MIYRPTGNSLETPGRVILSPRSWKDKKIVAATLLSVMGKECLHICRNLPMAEDERQDADVVLTKVGQYFEPKRNTIFEQVFLILAHRNPIKVFINPWPNLASFLQLANSARLKTKCYVTAFLVVYETTVNANDFFEILR